MNPVSLLFYLSPKSSYRPVLVSNQEIFCSPDDVDRQAEGQYQTMQAPIGQFDVKEILDRLSPEQQPELVVVKADASGRCVPRGLNALKCPKVLILGATHIFPNSITFLMEYAHLEGFDILVSDHNRQHTHFFRRAGFPKVYWLPGLNHCMRPKRIVSPASKSTLFVGQLGKYHPYRNALFSAFERSSVPFHGQSAPPEVAADLYGSHSVSLNCSLNGDMNLRVFEVMGTGGLLLTDRLSENSGQEMLFPDEEMCVQYGSSDELLEKAAHYIANEDASLAIRRRGFENMLAKHAPEIKRGQLMDLVFSDTVRAEYELDGSMGELVSLGSGSVKRDVLLYEFLQSANARTNAVKVFSKDPIALEFAKDLSRLRLLPLDESGVDFDQPDTMGLSEERILLVDCDDLLSGRMDATLSSYVGFDIWLVDDGERSAGVEEAMEGYGFAPASSGGRLYSRNDMRAYSVSWSESFPNAAGEALSRSCALADGLSGEELVELVERAVQLGRADLGTAFLKALLKQDRLNVEAYAVLSQLYCSLGEYGDELVCLLEANRLGREEAEELKRIEALAGDPSVASQQSIVDYMGKIGRGSAVSRLPSKQRILVYTNLFPPQELGGYGRKMWEFANELAKRGHEIRVLSGDAPYLMKSAQGEEAKWEAATERSLQLFGGWADGAIFVEEDREKLASIVEANRVCAVEAIEAFQPDLCLMGNLDLIGHLALTEFTKRQIPTVQCLGNQTPGWPLGFMPSLDYYRAGPASQWLRDSMTREGFRFYEPQVLYPGARTDTFYREHLPACDIPRIAFAGLLMAYKGPQTLMEALVLLKQGGIEFRATFAGDSTDQAFVEALKASADEAGFGDWVEFPGFLDRQGLVHLLGRSNIFAMPSVFEEPFGISQVEALASGLAVISSGRGGSKEIIRHEVDGLLFEGENAHDLAAKIASLVGDPKKWAQLCENGRRRAFDFSIPKTVDKLENLYQSMMTSVLDV